MPVTVASFPGRITPEMTFVISSLSPSKRTEMLESMDSQEI